jgi:hypothetical protein
LTGKNSRSIDAAYDVVVDALALCDEDRAVRTWTLTLLLVAGCKFDPRLGASDGGSSGDDSGGVAPPEAMFSVCFGTGLVRPCFPTAPSGSFDVTVDTTFNTDDPANCLKDVSGMNVAGTCVVAAGSISITRHMDVIGSKPLVLVATGSINVTGGQAHIDASSYHNGRTGAGATPTGCSAQTAPSGAGGGAAGGSFGGKGGDGGSIFGGGAGGKAGTIVTPAKLRGGCPGQNGANNALGGAGGGAIYLIAVDTINVNNNSYIDVSGAGGSGGTVGSNGAGGGGSGGMIGFDAAHFINNGTVWANGGGGGEGGEVALSAGGNGGESPDPNTAGGGGQALTNLGGNGGDSSSGTTRTGAVGEGALGVAGGGGGGGGGAGIIQIFGATSPQLGTMAPPPS